MAGVGLAQGPNAGVVRVPGRPVLWAIGGAGAAAAATSVAFSLSSDHVSAPGVQRALMGWSTVAYVFAGLIAWWRRPRNRLGPLMIAAGFGTRRIAGRVAVAVETDALRRLGLGLLGAALLAATGAAALLLAARRRTSVHSRSGRPAAR